MVEKTMSKQQKKWLIRAVGVLVFCVLAVVAWQRYGANKKDDGLVSGNGRIEAVEIDIAAKAPGRIKDILVKEGDYVTSGQVVALMDTEVLETQRREAEANLRKAQNAAETAQLQVAQLKSEEDAARALVAQREAECDVARKRLARTETLTAKGYTAVQMLDDDRAGDQCAQAALSAAKARVAAAEVATATARSQVIGTRSLIEASRAAIERLQVDIDDSALKTPRDGRVQYLVAQPGEVLSAGGRVLSMVDLSDVYMTFFLPTAAAGQIALGTEVRLVLDASPQYVVPAKVSFVADVAQFTPKTVETASEREKLMFRIKAQIPPDLLKKHITKVKTGLPGMAYLWLVSGKPWPARLQIKLPQ
jgi:HlyD family secretion protein